MSETRMVVGPFSPVLKDKKRIKLLATFIEAFLSHDYDLITITGTRLPRDGFQRSLEQKLELRRCWGIAFTGHQPADDELPCPADLARPPGSPGDHRRWGGNKPTGATGDPDWPEETAASRMMYGDKGGRRTCN